MIILNALSIMACHCQLNFPLELTFTESFYDKVNHYITYHCLYQRNKHLDKVIALFLVYRVKISLHTILIRNTLKQLYILLFMNLPLQAGCLTVAILLHYFFLAAFSWMLCEAIMLVIDINFVFYKGFFNSRNFFAPLGWGKHALQSL